MSTQHWSSSLSDIRREHPLRNTYTEIMDSLNPLDHMAGVSWTGWPQDLMASRSSIRSRARSQPDGWGRPDGWIEKCSQNLASRLQRSLRFSSVARLHSWSSWPTNWLGSGIVTVVPERISLFVASSNF